MQNFAIYKVKKKGSLYMSQYVIFMVYVVGIAF